MRLAHSMTRKRETRPLSYGGFMFESYDEFFDYMDNSVAPADWKKKGSSFPVFYKKMGGLYLEVEITRYSVSTAVTDSSGNIILRNSISNKKMTSIMMHDFANTPSDKFASAIRIQIGLTNNDSITIDMS